MKKIKLRFGKKYGQNPFIDYKPMHERYGMAEFEICPIFKNGKLQKFMIYPKQQENNNVYYEIPAFGQKQFEITSWTQKTDSLRIWMEFWCKEHKTICHRVYVPNNTDRIEFDNLTVFMIRFVKKDIKNGN